MLLGTLGASLLGNILTCQGAITKSQGRGINRAGEGIVREGYGNKKGRKTGCLLDYPYFKDHYKMIAIDLGKQQALDAEYVKEQ